MGERQHKEARGFNFFDPHSLVLIEDESHVLYDPRVHLAVDEDRAQLLADGKLALPPPIIVRRNGPNMEVVAGRQRTKSYRRANEIRRERGEAPLLIRGEIRQFESDRDLLACIVSENGATPEDPIHAAFKFNRLREQGMSPDEIGKLINRKAGAIKNILALLDCSTSVQRAVSKGEVPATVARELAKLTREKQDAQLERMKADGVTKGREAVTRARVATGRSEGPRMMTRKEIEAWCADCQHPLTKAVLQRVLGVTTEMPEAKVNGAPHAQA